MDIELHVERYTAAIHLLPKTSRPVGLEPSVSENPLAATAFGNELRRIVMDAHALLVVIPEHFHQRRSGQTAAHIKPPTLLAGWGCDAVAADVI
jgi:hypothetical protein